MSTPARSRIARLQPSANPRLALVAHDPDVGELVAQPFERTVDRGVVDQHDLEPVGGVLGAGAAAAGTGGVNHHEFQFSTTTRTRGGIRSRRVGHAVETSQRTPVPGHPAAGAYLTTGGQADSVGCDVDRTEGVAGAPPRRRDAG